MVRSTIPVALCSLALVWTGPAAAQAPPPRDTTVAGVTVTARSDLAGVVVNGRLRCTVPGPQGEKPAKPRVVDTWPRQGAVVAPGLLYLRVTYNERMSPCGFLLGSTLTGAYPEFQPEPALLSRDLRTFYFVVRTQPGTSYGVSFNALLVNAHFRSLRDVGAPAYGLHFSTSAAPPVETREAALAADPAAAHVDVARLLKLWAPRGDDGEDDDTDDGTPDLPLCGRCQGGVLAGPETPQQPAAPAP